MNYIKYIILTLSLMVGFVVAPVGVNAYDPLDEVCKGEVKDTAICINHDKDNAAKFVKDLVNFLLYVLGAVSVIVIIFAGIFYTTSIGDAASITKAKNTLLYAVVGLVVAVLSYAIVNFVLTRFT